jgi:hypothetical protein
VGMGALRWRCICRSARGYWQAALKATKDIENAMMELAQAQTRLEELEDEVTSLTSARDLSERAYKAGAITLMDVPDADRQLLVARNDWKAHELTRPAPLCAPSAPSAAAGTRGVIRLSARSSKSPERCKKAPEGSSISRRSYTPFFESFSVLNHLVHYGRRLAL